VAEGVERPEQLNLLRLKGCDLVQGYVFAKPLEPERVAGYISEFCPQKSTRTNGYAVAS
jgi:EAL domain-containing protein (putative c-di-GMP-specific phosphodiesterase class I)